MKTCATCQHFYHARHRSVRSDDFLAGECRATAPVRDFTWNRTKSHDYCALHSDNAPHFATGMTLTGATPLSSPLVEAAAPTTDQAAPQPSKARTRSRPARGELFAP